MKIKNVFLILVMGFSFLTVGYVFSNSIDCSSCTENCSYVQKCSDDQNILLAQLKTERTEKPIEKIENPNNSDSLKKDLPRIDTSKASNPEKMKRPVLEIDDTPLNKSSDKKIRNKKKEEKGIEVNTGIITSEVKTNEEFKKQIEKEKKIAEDKKRVFINQLNCVGCGQCADVCPVSAIEIIGGKAVIDYEKCISCYLCIRECNYRAIKKKKD